MRLRMRLCTLPGQAGEPDRPGVLPGQGERRMRDSNSRGVAPNTLSKCAPQRSCQAGTVRDLRSELAVGTGEPRCTQADETTNETGRSGENRRWRAGWARSPAVDVPRALHPTSLAV